MRWRPVPLLLLLLLPWPLLPQGLETEDLLRETVALYRLAGRPFPTVSLPVSGDELGRLLADLASSDAPARIRAQALALGAAREAESEGNRLDMEIEVRPEYYANVERGTFERQFAAESPFATLRMGYGRTSGTYLFIRNVLQREWRYAEAPTNVPRPQEGNPVPFENNTVREGYVYFPAGIVDLTFGRQRISVGPNPEHTLFVSSRVPFLDALKVTASFPRLKMTSVASTLENGRASPDTVLPQGPADPLYGFDLTTIVYNIHYFEYAWSRVRAGIGAQVVLARRMNSFQLGDFFPVFSWHNSDFAPNNMSLVADVTVTPLPNLEAYFQMGLDDVSGETFGISDALVPTIDAYVGGISYALPALGGTLAATGGYTHYLWGNYDLDVYLERAIYRLEDDGSGQSMPLTSPYGPGALWVELSAAGRRRDLAIAGSYLALGRLPGASVYSTPYETSPEISAAAREWTHRLELEIDYRFRKTLGATLTPALTVREGETELSLIVAGHVRFRTTRRGLP